MSISSKFYDEAKAEPLLALVKDPWTVYISSPFHNLQTSEVKFKNYASTIRDSVRHMNLHIKGTVKVTFAMMDSLQELYPGTLQIFVCAKDTNPNKQERSLTKLLYLGFLIPNTHPVSLRNGNPAYIFLTAGLNQVRLAVHKNLIKFFDCCIHEHYFAEDEMWLLATALCRESHPTKSLGFTFEKVSSISKKKRNFDVHIHSDVANYARTLTPDGVTKMDEFTAIKFSRMVFSLCERSFRLRLHNGYELTSFQYPNARISCSPAKICLSNAFDLWVLINYLHRGDRGRTKR